MSCSERLGSIAVGGAGASTTGASGERAAAGVGTGRLRATARFAPRFGAGDRFGAGARFAFTAPRGLAFTARVFGARRLDFNFAPQSPPHPEAASATLRATSAPESAGSDAGGTDPPPAGSHRSDALR